MEKVELYDFEDWWLGNVALCYSLIISNSNDNITIVKWRNFRKVDANRIKNEQKKIFHQSVNNLTLKLRKVFLSRYELSQLKSEFLKDEIKQCDEIMFSKLPSSELITFSHWDCAFERNDLLAIQEYIRRTLKNGIEYDFTDVHSPNFKFQNKNKIPSPVYAQFVWNHKKWLDSEFLKKENTNSNEKKLGVKLIALIHAYKGIHITKVNANEIASNYGYKSETSGTGLYQDYLLYYSRNERIKKIYPFTIKKAENKIKLFESVLPHLSGDTKLKAIDEINILKNNLESDLI